MSTREGTGIVLGPNRYGKAESRVVRIVRDTPRHEIHDLNVSTSLHGVPRPAFKAYKQTLKSQKGSPCWQRSPNTSPIRRSAGAERLAAPSPTLILPVNCPALLLPWMPISSSGAKARNVG